MGDICVDTTGAVETIVADQYGSAIADYYIHCPVDSDKKSGPLNTLILQAHLNIDESVRLVNQFSNISETSYSPKDVCHLSHFDYSFSGFFLNIFSRYMYVVLK